MTYTEEEHEVFTYFTDEEKEKIEGWLEGKNYQWGTATVCGNCCGFYSDEYWVGGVFGEWNAGDEQEFIEWAKQNDISCEVERRTIRAI